MDGARPKGKPTKTWREIVEKDCQARGLNREDAMDHNRLEEADKRRLMTTIGESG